MTWRIERRPIERDVERIEVFKDDRPATFRQVAEGWRDDPEFVDAFSKELTDTEFRAYRWECPPVKVASLDRPFECVLIRNDEHDTRPADRDSFADFFEEAELEYRSIAAFDNLHNDAWLVVPRPLDDEASYVHLASFLRTGPSEQIHDLWQEIGKTLLGRASLKPLWLSTAGMGISWLHVRFDERPKYYRHAAYARDRG